MMTGVIISWGNSYLLFFDVFSFVPSMTQGVEYARPKQCQFNNSGALNDNLNYHFKYIKYSYQSLTTYLRGKSWSDGPSKVGAAVSVPCHSPFVVPLPSCVAESNPSWDRGGDGYWTSTSTLLAAAAAATSLERVDGKLLLSKADSNPLGPSPVFPRERDPTF